MNFTLGLPNGSMQQPTIDLLSKIGIDICPKGRSGQITINGLNLFDQAILMRPQDMADALIEEKIDCGICGLDWIVETELGRNILPDTTIKRIKKLPYSRSIQESAKIVVFGRPDSPPIQQAPVTISTELPNLTRNAYPQAQISFSHGSTEIKVAMGQFDYGVCLTETGSSLRDNNLQIVDELLQTPTMLIARDTRPELQAFGDLLLGALEADRHQMIKLNVAPNLKDHVLPLLPALRSPTINTLSDKGYAVETVVPKIQTAELLIKLRTIGATDIIVQDINAIVH